MENETKEDLEQKASTGTLEQVTNVISNDGSLDDTMIISRGMFRRLAKKYNKKLGKEVTQEELIELINQDLITKRQHSLIIKEYFKVTFWQEILRVIMAALAITVVYDYFVTATGAGGIFPAGVGAIARFLATLTFPNNQSMVSSFFFVYQMLLNIPLFIFGLIKLGPKFSLYTVLFMGLQIMWDQILQRIPVINPSDLNFITDFPFLTTIGSAWNNAIWLFVFGLVGGALLGWTYSLIYKAGGSTAGTDFVTVYVSKKTGKPVGSINRNVNFGILAVVIICNAIILSLNEVGNSIIVQELHKLDWKTVTDAHGVLMGKSVVDYVLHHHIFTLSSIDNKYYLTDPELFIRLLGGLNGESPTDGKTLDDLNQIIQGFDVNKMDSALWQDVLTVGVQNGYGADLALKYKVLIKVEFIIGPSLFGSLTLIVMTSITTNYFYPKYKLSTFLISTNKPKEVNQKIINSGFQNEIASWDTTNRTRGNYLHRTVFMVSMPVMQWRDLQKELFMVDPFMKVTILRTKAIMGLFKFEPVNNDKRDEMLDTVQKNTTEIEKIRQIAIVKFKKEMDRVKTTRERLEQDYIAGGERRRRAEKELKRFYKNRTELIEHFRDEMNEFKVMKEQDQSVEQHNEADVPSAIPSDTKKET